MKMTTPRISRGAKSRVFLYIGAVIFVGITVIIIHETQTRVEDIRKSSEKCQQQQESLAAQLQVIFEYKTRLEKSVQQEKADHKKTHDELSTQLEIEKTKRAREVLEATNKLASLQQHYKLLQSQVTQLKSENEKLKKLVKEDGNEVSNLQDENQRLETEIQQCKRDVATCPTKSSSANAAPNLQSPVAASSSASPMQNNGKDPLHNVLQQPDGPKGSSAASLSSTRSTPKSNVAPVPAPGPDAPKPLVGAYEQVPPGVVPPGVVPAPQMMLHDDYTNNRDNFLPPSRDMAPPVLPGPFHNPFAAHKNQEDEEEQKKAVGAAPPDQKMWHQREEIEEDDDHHGAAGFQHYKEDEADRGAGRWNGGNHHLPEGERHEDLQLEDPDEDEGDDDVDQIDYGNDVINNNNQHGANLKQKSHRKSPMGNKHDSVMVNPK